jgi:hypothetical protein
MKKQFIVSLACLVPHNYNVVVKAKSEKEAIALAIADFEGDREKGDFEDIDGATIKTDFDEKEQVGIFCELLNQ